MTGKRVFIIRAKGQVYRRVDFDTPPVTVAGKAKIEHREIRLFHRPIQVGLHREEPVETGFEQILDDQPPHQHVLIDRVEGQPAPWRFLALTEVGQRPLISIGAGLAEKLRAQVQILKDKAVEVGGKGLKTDARGGKVVIVVPHIEEPGFGEEFEQFDLFEIIISPMDDALERSLEAPILGLEHR